MTSLGHRSEQKCPEFAAGAGEGGDCQGRVRPAFTAKPPGKTRQLLGLFAGLPLCLALSREC